MRIGIDVDGVVADFNRGYSRMLCAVTGKNLLGAEDMDNPSTWNWDLKAGYTKEEVAATWEEIKKSSMFWCSLAALPGAGELAELIGNSVHEFYFITNRMGSQPLGQTQYWLNRQMGLEDGVFSVLISAKKGLCAYALDLDVYIDDRYENILDVQSQSPKTLAFLPNRRYNQGPGIDKRIDGLARFIDLLKEGQ